MAEVARGLKAKKRYVLHVSPRGSPLATTRCSSGQLAASGMTPLVAVTCVRGDVCQDSEPAEEERCRAGTGSVTSSCGETTSWLLGYPLLMGVT